jgi:excisionase family DNA binding protein
MKQLLNVREFAEALGVTVSCARRWLLEGKIAKVKLGRLVRIPASECERLVNAGLRPARHSEGGRDR